MKINTVIEKMNREGKNKECSMSLNNYCNCSLKLIVALLSQIEKH